MVSFLKFGNKPKVTSSSTVGLTDTGKKIAEKFTSRGKTFAILSALNEKSPQSIKDLSDETQIDVDEIKARVKILATQGYVRLTGVDA